MNLRNSKFQFDKNPLDQKMKIRNLNLYSKSYLHHLIKSNEILACTGGTFYSRETPEAGEYVREGQHVEEGDVLGLLEVMKMFNQIRAEFPGTIRKICIDAGTGKIVARSQVLFQIDPDIPPVCETEEELFKIQQEQTISLMQSIIPAN